MGLAASGMVVPLSGPFDDHQLVGLLLDRLRRGFGQFRVFADLAGGGGPDGGLAAHHQVPAHGGHDAEDEHPQQQQESEAQGGNGQFAHGRPPVLAGSRRKMIFVRPIVMVEPSVSSMLPETLCPLT